MAQTNKDCRKDPRIRALLATTNEGFIVIEATGRVRLMNEAAEEMLGVKRSETIEHTTSVIPYARLRTEIHKALAPRARRERSFAFESDGRTFGCRLSRYRGDVDGVVVTLRDDTELVRQHERSEAILASTGDGLVVFDPDNRVTYINPAACEMLGVKASRVTGKHTTMSALLGLEPGDPSDAAPCWEIRSCGRIDCPQYSATDLRCWLRSGTLSDDGKPASFKDKCDHCFECDVYQRNCRLLEECGMSMFRELTLDKPVHRVIKTRTNPVTDAAGGYIGCVTSLHDITAEHEIGQMKNEFVSTVSHELRTPLTSIKGYVDLILDGEAGDINEIQQEFLSIVKENSDRLVELINDLLDISRIESGRIHLKVQPFDITETIVGAVDTFRAVLEQKGRSIDVDVAGRLPKVAGDPDRVGQVLVNLISNAIKYSPEGGKVGLKAQTVTGAVKVSVSDQGIGISREDQANLFTKFYRVDNALTRDIGGTGLGLSICKTIIELLGGKIGMRSQTGRGSTFWFTLPLAPKEMVRTPSLEGPLGGSGGKVLVVDRDIEIANLIETYLQKRGYDVIKAHSGKEAVKMAIEHKPRVITLDVMLDDVDGFELLQHLKENPETAQIPIVVLSIVCDEGRSCRLGAAEYLEKPIDKDRLVRMIDDLVGSVTSPFVLVVDDDKNIVEVLGHTLRARGFAVAGAYDGKEAMAAIAEKKPHLILLDIRMPVMDGYQVIQEVKTNPKTADIPIIVMTAHHIDREHIGTLKLAAQHVAKPFSAEHLVRHVEAVLRSQDERGDE